MRAFLGIPLPEQMRAALEDGVRAISDADPRWRDARWVRSENMHVTVAFLGDIQPPDADTLAEELAIRYAEAHTPELRFAGLRAVPGLRAPRMIWVCFDDPESLCGDLATQAFDAAARIGVAPPEKDFSAHATLARARSRNRLDPGVLSHAEDVVRARLGEEAGVMSDPSDTLVVRAVSLFESTLTRNGPEYTLVREMHVGS